MASYYDSEDYTPDEQDWQQYDTIRLPSQPYPKEKRMLPPAKKFKELPLDAEFRFVVGSQETFRKITPRKYINAGGFREFVVSSVNVAVVQIA